MRNAKKFIRTTEAKKQGIESRNKRQFIKFYQRVANDLINLIQKNRNINFENVFKNYQPDYIFLFRQIFNDTKTAGFGFEIRKQLNFDKSNIIEVKNIQLTEAQEDSINENFDIQYTELLNNQTEALANEEFLQKEAQYFQNIYNNSIKDYNAFTLSLQKDIQEQTNRLNEFATIVGLTALQRRESRIARTKQEALQRQLEKVQANSQKEVLRNFKRNVEDKIPIRSQGNTQYATGQATSKIKNLEYTSVVASTNSQQEPLFNVAGYLVPYPRHASLPISETAYCRCEVEYRVVGNVITKIWWEKTQFLGGKPREGHLFLSGTDARKQ